MKKILISFSVIAVVAALGVGGTMSFFNDTETSAGNVFTAGSIDLKVDHLAQTYDGVDCKTCSVTLVSDTTNKVVSTTNGTDPTPFPHNAVLVGSPNPAWQDANALSPAKWIWATDPTLPADTTNNAEYTFEKKFQWNGTAVSVNLNLALAADNGYKIILNGTTIVDNISTQFNYGSAVTLDALQASAFEAAMVNGENKLDIVVRNMSYPGGSSGNPAGLLFKLNISRDPAQCAADSAFQQACQLWDAKDLTGSEHFWDIGDVKPGDWGTNLISLHVSSNDAYTCLYTGGGVDAENLINDAESKANDVTASQGELSKYLSAVVWEDLNHDGTHQSGETVLYGPGPLSTEMTQRLALSTTSTGYLGLAWCMGTQTVDTGTGAISCAVNGSENDAQTDSFTADVTAYAVQQRNNSSFDCGSLLTPSIVTNPAN